MTVRKIIPIALSVLLASCSSTSTPEPEAEAKEVPAKKGSTDSTAISGDTTEEGLFQNARSLHSQGLFRVSKGRWEALAANYPLGAYAEFAEIKAADSDFQNTQFSAAATGYESFIANHPGSPDLPYVLYQAAQSHYLSYGGIGRDSTPLEKARVQLERLERDYSTSPFVGPARRLHAQIVAAIADTEREVRDFYEKIGAPAAQKARAELIDHTWTPLEERSKAVASESPPPPPAVKLTLVSTAPAEELTLGEISKKAALTPKEPNLFSGNRIQRVTCNNGSVQIFLTSSLKDSSFVNSNSSLHPKDGAIKLAIPNTAAEPAKLDCLGHGDLQITQSGEIQLLTSSSAQLMAVDYPPRLMIVFLPAAEK